MWAHVKTHGQCPRQCSGICRVFEDGQQFGDPYRYAFAFQMIDETTAEIVGISVRPPKPSEVRVALRAAKMLGWRVVRERKSGARQGMRDITRERI